MGRVRGGGAKNPSENQAGKQVEGCFACEARRERLIFDVCSMRSLKKSLPIEEASKKN